MHRAPRAPIGNQIIPQGDHDSWATDSAAQWWLNHLLDEAQADDIARRRASDLLHSVGQQVGSRRLRAAADRANTTGPYFVPGDDPRGNDDVINFDRAWDECIEAVLSSGVCGIGVSEPGIGWLVRAAAMEQWARLDIGVMCPVTMTSAAVPLLNSAGEAGNGPSEGLAQRLLDAAASGIGETHPLVGMAMTEPQGGSDLSGATVYAHPTDAGIWAITGHKWFCSHPTSDALLVLARDPEVADAEGTRGLSCFLVPGWIDEQRNGIVVQRLKDKLGTRSLASAEVVFDRALGVRVGEAGRGVATIMQMVLGTRMDCAIGSTGVLARAIGEVLHFAQQREAFGARLIEQPVMRMVLADLVLEREASLALSFEVARSVQRDEPLTGLTTAVAKYWITRRAVQGCIECVEAMGGNGYTEEYVVARLYRDAQVNSTWEGAGNVIALDVLRSLQRDPGLHDTFIERCEELVASAPEELAAAVREFAVSVQPPKFENGARRYVGRLAVLMQAALLVHRATHSGDAGDVVRAQAFIATRLGGTAERVFGDGDERLAEAAEHILTPYVESALV